MRVHGGSNSLCKTEKYKGKSRTGWRFKQLTELAQSLIKVVTKLGNKLLDIAVSPSLVDVSHLKSANRLTQVVLTNEGEKTDGLTNP